MTNKDRTRLSKLNSVCNSINRVIEFGVQILKTTTTEDLRALQIMIRAEQQELLKA